MGHSSSSAICDKKALVVDLASAKGAERLAAVALTKTNVPSTQCYLFSSLHKVRCEESVHHWFQAEHTRDSLPPAPSPQSVYDQLVVDSQCWSGPVPIAVLRLKGKLVEDGGPAVLLGAIQDSEDYDVVGYVACRPRSPTEATSGLALSDGVHFVEFFMTKVFQNEAKSLSLLEIACKCFTKYGRSHTGGSGKGSICWPSAIAFSTMKSNLPHLRLAQKVLSLLLVNARTTIIAAMRLGMTVLPSGPHRATLTVADASAVKELAVALAGNVVTAAGRLVVSTRPVEKMPLMEGITALEALIEEARAEWKESNRVVIESTNPQLLVSSKKDIHSRSLRVAAQQHIRRAEATSMMSPQEHATSRSGENDPTKSSSSTQSPSAVPSSPTISNNSSLSNRSSNFRAPAALLPAAASKTTTVAHTYSSDEFFALSSASFKQHQPIADTVEYVICAGAPIYARDVTMSTASSPESWDCVFWGSETRCVALHKVQTHPRLLRVVPVDGSAKVIDITAASDTGYSPFTSRPYLLEDGCFMVDPSNVYCYSHDCECFISYEQLTEFGGHNSSNACTSSSEASAEGDVSPSALA